MHYETLGEVMILLNIWISWLVTLDCGNYGSYNTWNIHTKNSER